MPEGTPAPNPVSFVPKKHRALLTSAEGLQRLPVLGIAESAHLDFKVGRDRAAPDFATKVRISAGALGTSGVGVLVIGVDESRDGKDRAVAVPGIPSEEARRLAQSIGDCAATRIDPPLNSVDVQRIDIGGEREVVVCWVRGRRGYPVSIERDDGTVTFHLRSTRSNVTLKAAEARLRRRELQRTPWLLGVAVLALLALGSAAYAASKIARMQRRRTVSQLSHGDLAASLRTRDPGHVQIAPVMGDAEAAIYGSELARVFQSGGWTTETAIVNWNGNGTVLVGGRVPVEGDAGCEFPYHSAVYRAALAMQEVGYEGVLQCDVAVDPERPILFIGHDEFSAAGQWTVDAFPPATELTYKATLPEPYPRRLPDGGILR